MSTPSSIAGHPIHPMLVALPIGLWVFSLVADLVFLATGNSDWQTAAYLTLGGGLIGALIAAIPGFIDYLALEDARARRTAGIHMGINLAIVAVMAVNFWLRAQPESAGMLPFWLSVLSVGALLVSGWLGGHLVHVLGVTLPHAPGGAHDKHVSQKEKIHRHA